MWRCTVKIRNQYLNEEATPLLSNSTLMLVEIDGDCLGQQQNANYSCKLFQMQQMHQTVMLSPPHGAGLLIEALCPLRQVGQS